MKNYIIVNECDHIFNSNNFYVYELIDPRTNSCFYVGKGRENRGWKHILMRNNPKIIKTNPHKANKINNIISEGHQIIVKITYTYEIEELAFQKECELITKYGRQCDNTGILTNINEGGEGNTQSGKPIDQYTMWGEFITTYKNAKEAARLLGYPNYSGISSCCTGKERSYRGSLWTYSGETPTILSKVKPLYQWTLDGVLVNIYRNASVAARAIHVSSTSILDCAKGYTRQVAGFMWSYDNNSPVLLSHKKKRKVIHLNTNKIYNSITEIANITKHNIGDISACCKGKKQKVGNDKFCYLEDFFIRTGLSDSVLSIAISSD